MTVSPARVSRPRPAAADLATSTLILGDNRDVLVSLLGDQTAGGSLRGMVKLCYLDPPYNTGSRFSTYFDSRPSDEWLDDLRDRLVLVRDLLRPDGSVWLHLDDSEQHRARVVLDEVFGTGAFVSTIIWEKRRSRDNRKAFSTNHDYIHVYSPQGPKAWKNVRNGLPNAGAYSNPDNDPRGPWRSVPMTAQAGHATRAQFYTVTTPTGETHDPPPGRCWTYSERRLEELVAEGRVYWPRGGAGRPRLKRFSHESSQLAPSTIWTAEFAGDTAEAKKELLASFPGRSVFDTPKPQLLMERIITIATDPGDLVLDPYLGSGTTGVAAAIYGRTFVGVEAEPRVLRDIAAVRVRQVAPDDRVVIVDAEDVTRDALSEPHDAGDVSRRAS
ncbi:site-specific DNA-methyltransferase [Pseudolysinimonas sp.]